MEAKFAEREVVKWIGSVFEIDSKGRVWRIANRAYLTGQKCFEIRPTKRRRAEHSRKTGYLQIFFMVNHKKYCTGAHRLVWQYFFGDIPKGLEINHVNGIKNDNRPKNLELVTPAEQAAHAFRIGLRYPTNCGPNPNLQGSNNKNAKLTESDVTKIFKLDQAGYHPSEIALLFPVGRTSIINILKGWSWVHVSGLKRRQPSKKIEVSA